MAANDPCVQGLDVYIVGGAVRDELLGLPAGDRDWVVVGATPEMMVARGFTPVGGDFPVFLHPHTHEEYALARTERKSGRGYHGFVFHAGQEVTLAQDLERRDLTINAIARAADGQLHDPLNGRADIRRRVLRHVGPAFAEDPVRLLRLARFAARFSDFSIAPDTLALCRQLVENGEVDALVPERVWQEFAKGLMSAQPVRMFHVLQQCGALARIAPGFAWDARLEPGLLAAARQGMSLEQRYALAFHQADAQLHGHLRAPTACRDMALLLAKVRQHLGLGELPAVSLTSTAPDGATVSARPANDGCEYDGTKATTRPGAASGEQPGPEVALELMQAGDAMRRPERFIDALAAAACLYPQIDIAAWQARVDAVRQLDAGAIARASGPDAASIQQALWHERLRALQALP